MALGADKVVVYPSDQQIRASALLAASNLNWSSTAPPSAIAEVAQEFVEYIKTGEISS